MTVTLVGGPKDLSVIELLEGTRLFIIPSVAPLSAYWCGEGESLPVERDPLSGDWRMKRPAITHHLYEVRGNVAFYKGEEK